MKKLSRRQFIENSSLFSVSISPALNALSNLMGVPDKVVESVIDCSFRLTDWHSLLNLEFYFINVEYKGKSLFSKSKLKVSYGQEESFMIVRLPQQHIAESYFDTSTNGDGTCTFNETNAPGSDWVAKTVISGYSYLVFKILFPKNDKIKIQLNRETLLDWNNEGLFRLVIRQNLQESLFKIEIRTKKGENTSQFYENSYPFGYKKSAAGKYEYDKTKFPKAYGSPITAIEAPWRLIISPKLPDQNKYKFHWEFSNTSNETIKNELWTARLTVQPRKDFLLEKSENNAVGDEKKQVKSLDETFSQMELMFLGSPDYGYKNSDHARNPELDTLKVLPKVQDRDDLAKLYIKYKLLARTSDLTFSPLGISTFFEFKNTLEKEEVSLKTYKHFISFGRDVEVEVSNLILEKETGLKMLHIQTTKRRTKAGKSFLDYREFIMPLELEKDYKNHEDKDGISKFNNPFKHIRFTETAPKRICPIPDDANNDLAMIKSKEGVFYPQVASSDGRSTSNLNFEFEIIDWHDKSIKITKNIQAITFKATDHLKVNDINDFFKGVNDEVKVDDIEKQKNQIAVNYSSIVSEANNLAKKNPFYGKTVEQIIELKSIITTGRLKEVLSSRKSFIDQYLKNQEIEFRRVVQSKLNEIVLKKEEYTALLSKNYDLLIKEITNKKREFDIKLSKLNEQISKEKEKIQDNFTPSLEKLNSQSGKFSRIKTDFKENQDNQASVNKEIKKIKDKIDELDPGQVEEIKKLKLELKVKNDFLAALVVKGDILRNTNKDILGEENIDSIHESVNDIIKKINNVLIKIEKQIQDINVQINEKFIQIDAKFQDDLDKVKKSINDLITEITRLETERANNIRLITKNLRTNAFLKLIEEFKKKVEDISLDCENLKKDFFDNLNNFLKNDFNQKIKKLIDLMNKFPIFSEVTVIGIDGKEIKIDISPIFSDYLNEISNKLKAYLDEFAFRYVRDLENADAVLKSLIEKFKKDVFEALISLKEQEKKVKNLIYTYRNKIGYAVNQVNEDIEDFVNEELSNLETDFIKLNGELKTRININDGKEVIDFFHQYASVPQLQYARVYVASVSKLINQDIPVSIQYAKEYVKYQFDTTKLEIDKNASRVFAEIREASKAEIQGKIRELSSELGGLVTPELPLDYITYLRDPRQISQKLIDELPANVRDEIDRVKSEINIAKKEIESIKNEIESAKQNLQNAANDIKHEIEQKIIYAQEKLKSEINNYRDKVKSLPIVNDLVLIGKEAKDLYDEVKYFNPQTYFKDLEAKILGSINLKEILGIDFELPRLTPSKDGVTYNFMTDKLKSKDFSFFRFTADTSTKFQIYLSKKIRGENQGFQSFTKLNNFKVVVRIASEDVLLISFKEFNISTDQQNNRKVSVQLDKVTLGGPLDFFGKLAEKFKMPGSGLRIVPSFNQLEVGYTFPISGISTPGFNFTNLKFDVGIVIPFAKQSEKEKELTLLVGINRPGDKFLISVGIFGGRGHFQLEATPRSLEKIDAAIEFGGYIGINLGIASGYVFLFAGIRLIYEKSGNLTLVGYLICEGGVTVFGFISIYVTLQLALTYRRVEGKAALYGSASLSYSIKIGFFKKSFTLSFSKTIAGEKGNSSIKQDETTVFNEKPKNDLLYASLSNDIIAFDDYEVIDEEKKTGTKSQKKKKGAIQNPTSFKSIYKKKHWEDYCNSFSF